MEETRHEDATRKPQRKVKITGTLTFLTAFHIGTGMHSDFIDSGVLLDHKGLPLIPGSSIKGVFRSTVEKYCHVFEEATTCFLSSQDPDFCANSHADNAKVKEEWQAIQMDEDKERFIKNRLCTVCQLFGSNFHAGRILFSDSNIESNAYSENKHASSHISIRDGVTIDRDSETAVDRMKYDYECVEKGLIFPFEVQLLTPSILEEKLVVAALADWEHEVLLGGKTTRGLGRARLDDIQVKFLDYSDKNAVLNFLLTKKWQEDEDWQQKKQSALGS